MSKNKKFDFFYRGIFYETKEDFLKAVYQYSISLVHEISIRHMMDDFEKTLCFNIFSLFDSTDLLTNGEMSAILDETLMEILVKISKKLRKNKNHD